MKIQSICVCYSAVNNYICLACLQATVAHMILSLTAMFTVRVRGKGSQELEVSFQNVRNPQHWIAIRHGETIGTVSDVINNDVITDDQCV